MSEPYDVTTSADISLGQRRFCDRTGRTWVEPLSIGDPVWFDIPALMTSIDWIMMADIEDFQQWQSGEHAAEWANRLTRMLTWVQDKQQSRLEDKRA